MFFRKRIEDFTAEQTMYLDVLTARVDALVGSSSSSSGGVSSSSSVDAGPPSKKAKTGNGGDDGSDGHGFIVGSDGFVQVFTDGAASFNGQKSKTLDLSFIF